MTSRIASSLAPRARVEAPPVGFRPPALSTKEKLAIVVRQRGMDPSGEALDFLGEGVEWDHVPAIHLRRWDPVLMDTVPPSRSIEHVEARNKSRHATKTAQQDIPEIAKTRRLEAEPKPKKPWPSRPFQKRKPAR